MKIRVGIDIGSDGAYAIFVDGQLKKYSKIPKVSDELNMSALIDAILAYWNDDEDATLHVIMEDLHSIFGSSAKSNFAFGVNNGLVIGALQAMRMPYTKVQARKWQKEMWEGIRPVKVPVMKKKKGEPAYQEKDSKGEPKYKTDTKATSLVAAKRLFPNETFLASARSEVPHDGIVDAVLIGTYCSRHF